jgi:hypothetical protein
MKLGDNCRSARTDRSKTSAAVATSGGVDERDGERTSPKRGVVRSVRFTVEIEQGKKF